MEGNGRLQQKEIKLFVKKEKKIHSLNSYLEKKRIFQDNKY